VFGTIRPDGERSGPSGSVPGSGWVAPTWTLHHRARNHRCGFFRTLRAAASATTSDSRLLGGISWGGV